MSSVLASIRYKPLPYMGGHQLDGVPPICPGHGRLDRPHRRSAPVSWKVAAPPARGGDFWRTVASAARGARDCINLGLALVARVSE